MTKTTAGMFLCILMTVLAPGAAAQLLLGNGTVIVEVVTVPQSDSRQFTFAGIVSGSISHGERLEESGLISGEHTATQVSPGPDYVLTAIECDDSASASPSSGNITTRTAAFNIDQGETVVCTFTNTAADSLSQSSSGGSSDTLGGVNPFETPDENFDDFDLPGDLPPGAGDAAVPRAGPWNVRNFAGQMSCGGFNVPLRPQTDRGELEVLDGGRTVLAVGMSEDTADLSMFAVPGIQGRYAGSVGSEQDGIPMTIDFFWQLITEEWITGYLTSTVAQQGMVCNMFRTFELRYAG